MMRPLYTVLSLVALSALLALQTGHALLYQVTYFLLATVVLSGAWAWLGVRGLRVLRQTHTPQTQVGQLAEEGFVVHNSSRLPKLWLEVRDHSDLPDHQASFVISRLAPGERYTWNVKTLCQQRGRFNLGPITLAISDPLGLFEVTKHLKTTSAILVTPAALNLASVRLEAGRVGGGDAVRGRAHEITANVATVRDYAPGDSFKRIHWPSTARLSRIVVKEFEIDPRAEVWLFLDLDRSGFFGSAEPVVPPIEPPLFRTQRYVWEPIPNTEEYSVILTASLARYFVHRSRAVGLVAYDSHRHWLKPAHGHHQLDRILQLLALVRTGGEVPLSRMLEEEGTRLGRNGLACIVTATPDEEWVTAAQRLARRGPSVTAFFVDGTGFGDAVHANGVLGGLRASHLSAFSLQRGGIRDGQIVLSPVGGVTQ